MERAAHLHSIDTCIKSHTETEWGDGGRTVRDLQANKSEARLFLRS